MVFREKWEHPRRGFGGLCNNTSKTEDLVDRDKSIIKAMKSKWRVQISCSLDNSEAHQWVQQHALGATLNSRPTFDRGCQISCPLPD